MDLEASEERFERFEKIDQGIVTLAHIFDRLAEAIGALQKYARANPNRTPTPRSIPIPAKIALAGGKG